MRDLRQRLVAGVTAVVPEAVVLGSADPAERLPGIAGIAFPGCSAESLLLLLDETGSALFTIGCLIMCAAGLWFFVNRTKTGRGMQAVSQDPDTARLMGINVDRIIVVAFAVGATLAAVAGVAQGLAVTNINFRMGFLAGLKAFTAAVFGGIGNLAGAMVGGVLLGLIESLGAGYIGMLTGGVLGSHYQDIFAFAVLIIVLLFRPSGIMGERVAERA